MRKRVFELAREMGMSSKELLVELKHRGVDASSHMTQLDDEIVEQVRNPSAAKKKEALTHDPFAGLKPGKRILIKKAKAVEAEPLAEPPAPLPPETHEKKGPMPPPVPPGLKKEPEPAVQEPSAKVDLFSKEKKAEPTEPAVPAGSSPRSETEPIPDHPFHPAHPADLETVSAPDGRQVSPLGDVLAPTARPLSVEPGLIQKAEPVIQKDKPKKAKREQELQEEGWGPLGARKWKNFKAIPKKEKRSRGLVPEKRSKEGPVSEITKPRRKMIKFHEGITVKDFAESIGQKGNEIIAKLMEMGIMSTINQPMDTDAAILIADGFGLKMEVAAERGIEEEIGAEAPDAPDLLQSRSPVVTVMGHVDHGKTSLLDAIRKTRVTEKESGGITQHIGAYTVDVHGRSIVFLDTPGHEAFTDMRARGAKVTDIVVLVVAADDGVMPQTVEAINHARAAQVPIIVAINKIDKPGANSERIRQDLTKYELVPEAWGGQTIFAEVSAKKNIGLDHLLEMILLQADVLELKANPDKQARGTILEAKLDRGRGPVATVLVQAGTLRAGDPFVCGSHFGKVRNLINDEGKQVKEAFPSAPVEVIGLSGVPQAGDSFAVVEDEKVARSIASVRMQRQRVADLEKAKKITLDELYTQIKSGAVRELNIIIKADVQGSAEAIAEALEKLSCEAVKLRVIHQGAGGITETDVMLASASNAIIIGFNVRPESKAHALAEREQVDIRHYDIIYEAVADIRAAMEGLLEPTLKERMLGRAEVRQVFQITKVGTVCGSYVTEGVIPRSSAGVRVLRDNVVIYEGKLGSLRRFKEDVREVQAGYECGIGIENFNDIKVGDVIEAYTVDKVAAKLDG